MKRFIAQAVQGAGYQNDQILGAREIGQVRIALSISHDDYWYGSHGDTAYVAGEHVCSKGDYLYHRRTETVRKYGESIWRDSRGRICAEPEVYQFSRECEFIRVRYALSGKDAIQDAQYLEKIENGDYYPLCCQVLIEFMGREIGRASLSGVVVERTTNHYLVEVLSECAGEALAEARMFLESVRGVAA